MFNKNRFICSVFPVCILIIVSCTVHPIINDNKLKNQFQAQNPSSVSSNNATQIQVVQFCNTTIQPVNYSSGLLSPRVYAGILEPNSYLISNFGPLRDDIRSYIIDNNLSASVYVENLRNGVNIGINQNRGYFPASLNKLPIAVLVMENIEDGKWTMDTILPIHENEKSSASGMLYLSNETQLAIRELMQLMLKESDNTAFNVLYDAIDKDEERKLLEYYDVKINLDYPHRRLEFANHTDQVTAISMYNLFSSLYLSTVLADPKDSEYILSLLANSDFDIKRIANLPDNVTVAQKYGEYYADGTKQFHDCGIVYIDQTKIFYCVMTRDLDAEDAKGVIGHIVNYIYNYVVYTRAELDELKNHNSRTKS